MTKRRTALAVAALIGVANAQTWSPFPLPGLPIGTVSASAAGLMSVDYSTGTMLVREWDGLGWGQRNPTSTPPNRVDFSMAYDSARQRVVLFGGRNGSATAYFADTWEWTGSDWQPQVSLTFPTPHAGARMVFDTARSRMVMFGGSNGLGIVGDTWEYNAPNWTLVQPTGGPPPRVDHAMAYDPVRQRTVLFGGWNIGVNQFGDTWEWNGVAWTQRFPASPPQPRSQHGMAFDPYSGGVLMFGGVSSNFSPTYFAEPHLWTGTAWMPKSYYVSPTARARPEMALDSVHQSLVVLGGYDGTNLSDGWVFPGSIAAVAQPFGSGCGLLTLASAAPPILGQTQQSLMARPTGSMALSFMAVGLSEYMLGPFMLPLPLSGFGFTGCFLYHDTAITVGLPCAPTGFGQAMFSIGIPNQPVLSGMRLFLQGWVFDPSVNAGGVITSNAMQLVLGNF